LSKVEEKVEELVTKTINDLGYDVYDVMYVKEGKDNYLRIFIDNSEGISLEDCEKVNNAITDMLDDANYIKDQYFLEISSPGIERHIRKEKHLQQSIGEDVYVKTFDIIPNLKSKEITGVLKEFDENSILIELDNDTENENIVKIDRKNIALMKRIYKW
jgi:ribosome maturation factor RimP